MAEPKGLAAAVSEWVVGLAFEMLPAEGVALTRLAALDGLGLMVAGAKANVTQIVRRYGRSLGTAGVSTCVGAGLRLPAELSALHNGTAAHAREADAKAAGSGGGTPSAIPIRRARAQDMQPLDVHACILSAVLAVAEELGASGKELVTAYAAGAQVARALTPVSGTRGRTARDAAGWAATVGAALSVAKLLELDAPKTRVALGVAASAGAPKAWGVMARAHHGGTVAERAVVAVRLATLGLEGTAEDIECLADPLLTTGAIHSEAVLAALKAPLPGSLARSARSFEDSAALFRTRAEGILDARPTEQAIAAIGRLETLRDVRELTRSVAGESSRVGGRRIPPR